MTIAEFDEIAEKATEARDYELIDGEIVMMTNPKETHEQIASNIGARLKLAMDSRGCRTYQGGMRVQADQIRKRSISSNRMSSCVVNAGNRRLHHRSCRRRGAFAIDDGQRSGQSCVSTRRSRQFSATC
ncbi:MAG: Uma2 family endonuclease [Roseiarcus sp.]